MKSCGVCKLAGLLVVIGAINWGLVGFFQFDLVATLLGPMTTASRIVYGLVGIAGLMKLIGCFKACPKCCTPGAKSGGCCS